MSKRLAEDIIYDISVINDRVNIHVYEIYEKLLNTGIAQSVCSLLCAVISHCLFQHIWIYMFSASAFFFSVIILEIFLKCYKSTSGDLVVW